MRVAPKHDGERSSRSDHVRDVEMFTGSVNGLLSDPILIVSCMDISIERMNALQTAIELGVDDSDFRFQSHIERELWVELVVEHEARADKDDSIWLAAS